ncbi:MAG: DedA family protein [Candidatus Rokubacteria bacterium]|nr:DedA family protein [Candidatus Rokubacteria bacterium]
MLETFIEEFAYLGIFLTLLGGSLGLPIPEELPIVTSGVLAHQLVVRWWIALPVCLVGVLSGDVVLYWVGHHWGERILEWPLVRRVLPRRRAEWLKARYRRYGVRIVFAARHVMGLRAAAFLTAGIARFSFWRFFLVDAGAAIVGVSLQFTLAYLFTDQIERILIDVHRAERWAALVLLVAVAAGLAIAAYRRARRDVGIDPATGEATDTEKDDV